MFSTRFKLSRKLVSFQRVIGWQIRSRCSLRSLISPKSPQQVHNGIRLMSITHTADLEGAALDLDLYRKSAGALSGRQGIPSLDQIKDVFGANRK